MDLRELFFSPKLLLLLFINPVTGLVFVLTGVYDSLERDQVADIVKNYGGKVGNPYPLFSAPQP